MRILITNDDGYKAEGINVLADVMESYGHEVWMVAPSKQRSAHSQKITMHKGIHITQLDKRRYFCSGTPADCMLFSLKDELIPKPDVVISGVNHGTNLSTDINYSGTVGAAKEGAMWGIKSIALSAKSEHNNNKFNFKGAAIFLANNLELFMKYVDYKTILNINCPYIYTDKWEVGGVGILEYKNAIEKVEVDLSSEYIIVGGNAYLKESDTRSDFDIIEAGNISVTPLLVVPNVDNKKLEELRKIETVR